MHCNYFIDRHEQRISILTIKSCRSTTTKLIRSIVTINDHVASKRARNRNLNKT